MAEYPKEITQRFHGTPEQNAIALVGERPARWDHIVIEDYDPGWADRFAAARSLLEPGSGRPDHRHRARRVDLGAGPAGQAHHRHRPADRGHGGRVALHPRLGNRWYRLVLREPWWYGHRMLVSPAEDVHLHCGRGRARADQAPALPRLAALDPQDRDLYAAVKRRLARDTVDQPADYSLAKNDVIDDIYTRIFAGGP